MGCIPTTFKEAMGLPQAARWKAKSDTEIASLEKLDFFNLIPITSVPMRHDVVSTRWVFNIKVKGTYKDRLVEQGVSQTPGAYSSGVESELSLNQPEEKLLNEEEKQRYQAITRAVMYLAQVTRYDILYAVNQLARAMSRESSYGGGQDSASLLDRVHRLLHHLQAGRLQACCFLE